MTQNEIKQIVLSHLKKVQDSTSKEMAEDLLWTEKTDKNRLNKVLTGLKEEGLIEAEKVMDSDIGMKVNSYRLTPEGFDAIEPSFDLDGLDDTPKQAAGFVDLTKMIGTVNDAEDLNEADFGYFDDIADIDYSDTPEEQEDKLTKWMLVIEGETLIYNDLIEANSAAEQYAIECGATVQMYALEAQFLGQFEQVTRAVFKSPCQLQQEAA